MKKSENSTKKKIRENAIELFNSKGFENVTINEICSVSGVNKHTFYYYFKSKDEILQSLYEIPDTMTEAELADIMTADSYVEQLWLLNIKFIEFIAKLGNNIAKQLFIKNLSENVGTFKLTHEKKERLKLNISIIEKAQKNGEIRNQTDANVLLVLFAHAIHGSTFIWCVHDASFDYITSIRFLFESLFDVAPQFRTVDIANFKKMWED